MNLANQAASYLPSSLYSSQFATITKAYQIAKKNNDFIVSVPEISISFHYEWC